MYRLRLRLQRLAYEGVPEQPGLDLPPALLWGLGVDRAPAGGLALAFALAHRALDAGSQRSGRPLEQTARLRR